MSRDIAKTLFLTLKSGEALHFTSRPEDAIVYYIEVDKKRELHMTTKLKLQYLCVDCVPYYRISADIENIFYGINYSLPTWDKTIVYDQEEIETYALLQYDIKHIEMCESLLKQHPTIADALN